MSLALLERFTHGLPTERIPWEDSAEKQPGHGAGGNYHASLSTFENGSRRPSTRDHLSLCLHELIRFIVTITHFSLTRRRMEQANTTILILHDTTELNFTSHYALDRLPGGWLSFQQQEQQDCRRLR